MFEFAKTIDYNFTLLDIGGGFNGERNSSIHEVANVINSSLEEYFAESYVNVIAEPEHFYVNSAYTLACNVHSVRTTGNDSLTGEKKVHHMYYLNDGIFGSFVTVMEKSRKPFPKCLNKVEDIENLYSSSLWGYTPNSNDQVRW